MPLVYGDGFAAVFGPKSKSGKYTIFGNTKSLLGSGIISLFSIISVFGGILVMEGDLMLAIYVSLITGIMAPIIENLSPKGTDNLFIPIILSILFFVIPDTQFLDLEINTLMFSIGAIVGLLIASLGFFSPKTSFAVKNCFPRKCSSASKCLGEIGTQASTRAS